SSWTSWWQKPRRGMAVTPPTRPTAASSMAAASNAAVSAAQRSARGGYWLRLAAVALTSLLVAAALGVVGGLPAPMAPTLLHPVRVPLTITPASLRLPYADVTIHARGAELAGWYVPGEGDAAVVLVHGVPGSRAQMLPYVPVLHAAGYHVLLYDQRA